MAEKKNILFIINPISGVGKKNRLPLLIEEHLDHSKYNYKIVYTQYRKHGQEIAAAEKSNYNVIVAVGGDGSVNEIGSALVGSDCALAIIPCGSGNGLARHANIPLKSIDAIARINIFNQTRIDTGKVNEHIFLGTCGFGFDAYIAKKFDEFNKRGFLSYVRLVLREYRKYQQLNYKITIQNKSFEKKAFLCSVANSSQFGNGFTLSPFSDLQDGKFELIFLSKVKLINLPFIVGKFFRKRINQSRHFESVTFENEIRIELQESQLTYFHLDGEPMDKTGVFDIKILPASLILI